MPRIHLLVVVMALVLTAAGVSAPQDPAAAQDTLEDRVYAIAPPVAGGPRPNP